MKPIEFPDPNEGEDAPAPGRKKVKVTTEVPAPLPPDYIPVRFIGSKGKLSAPPVLHFRNYSFEDAIKLAQANDDTIDETIIGVLNGMVHEDFDCGLLHREEVKEILLAIHGSWWGKSLDFYYYAIDENLPMETKHPEAASTYENRSIAVIPIGAVDVVGLPDDFAEPVTVKSPEGRTMQFVLSRMANSMVADRKVAEMFDAEEASFLDIRWTLNQNEKRSVDNQLRYDQKDADRYREFLTRKIDARIRILQALQVYSVDGKIFQTLDEKLDALKTSMNFFSSYRELLVTKLVFGLKQDVTFECSIKKIPITRRFPFRCVDLVPSMEQNGDKGYSVSFG